MPVTTTLPTCCAVIETAYLPEGVTGELDSVGKLLLEQEVSPSVAPANVIKQARASRRASLNLRRATSPISPKPNNTAKVIGERDR